MLKFLILENNEIKKEKEGKKKEKILENMTKGKTRSVSKFFKELVFVFVMYIDLGLLNNNNKKTEKNLDVLYSTCLSHLFTSA